MKLFKKIKKNFIENFINKNSIKIFLIYRKTWKLLIYKDYKSFHK